MGTEWGCEWRFILAVPILIYTCTWEVGRALQ